LLLKFEFLDSFIMYNLGSTHATASLLWFPHYLCPLDIACYAPFGQGRYDPRLRIRVGPASAFRKYSSLALDCLTKLATSSQR